MKDYRQEVIELLKAIQELSDAYNSDEDESNSGVYHRKLDDAWSELDAVAGGIEESLRADR